LLWQLPQFLLDDECTLELFLEKKVEIALLVFTPWQIEQVIGESAASIDRISSNLSLHVLQTYS